MQQHRPDIGHDSGKSREEQPQVFSYGPNHEKNKQTDFSAFLQTISRTEGFDEKNISFPAEDSWQVFLALDPTSDRLSAAVCLRTVRTGLVRVALPEQAALTMLT